MANYKHGGRAKKMADGGRIPPAPSESQTGRLVTEAAPKVIMPPESDRKVIMPPESDRKVIMPPEPIKPPPTPPIPTVPQRTVASEMAMPKRRVPVMPRRGSAQMMAEGGSVGSASKRADGCAQRGKTKGKMY